MYNSNERIFIKKVLKRHYLDELINVIGTEDIKVITGIRRSGKSFLLKEFEQYLIKKYPDDNIIFLDFSLVENEDLLEYHALNDYVNQHFIDGKRNFVLIDEVQMCEGFEHTVNSLHASKKYDLYVTGSNAFLSSSDLATLFTGRTYTINMYPFSFKEYVEYHDNTDIQTAFERYFLDGGLPGSYQYQKQEQRYKYVREVYDTILTRDIQRKYKIKNTYVLNAVCDFLTGNVSKITSMRNIALALNDNKQAPDHPDTNHVTVGQYVSYLCEAYAFVKMSRYDIQGKQYLASLEKYYLTEHSFHFARLGTRMLNYGHIYENIVAIELLRRGYEVYVGALWDTEVDFVAKKNNEKIYIQVSSDITDSKTFARETKPLLDINDAYSKILIARTRQPEADYEGIKILDIAEWLMSE